MLRRLRALVRRYEQDTEGRLRLELAATKAALRDALRDQARERAEGAAALREAVRERDAWRTRVSEALGGRSPLTDQLGATVERIERLMSAYQGCRESERALQRGVEEIEGALMGRPNPPFSVLEDVVEMAHKMRARRDRWRERVAPSEDRVVALTKELRATQGRLRQAERERDAARDALGAAWADFAQEKRLCLLQTLGLPVTARMTDSTPPPLPEAPEFEIILGHPAGHEGLVDERCWYAPLPENLQRAMTGALALFHLLHGCAAPAEVSCA